MDATSPGFQVVATTDAGTRRALTEAARLANGSGVRVLLLVPQVISFLRRVGNPHEATEITDRYRAIAADAGVDARVRLCVCHQLDDIFRWMLGPRSQIVIGGRRGRWWPTSAERLAERLKARGHDVVFAAD
jgi:hypothetical protein